MSDNAPYDNRDEMVTVTFEMPRRDAYRLAPIIDVWLSETTLSDRAYERWRATERAIADAVRVVLDDAR